jgi:tetratricopeptide (TPR) repeat protein
MRTIVIVGTIVMTVSVLAATTVLAVTPEELAETYARSYTYEQVDDYQNAIRTLTPLLEKDPEGYTINLRLGWLYYLSQNYANSIRHYQEAMKAVPSSLEAKLGYTLPLMAQGKFSEVESIAYRIIDVDHYNYYANLKLAYSLRMQGKLDLARKVIDKMLALYPIDVNYLSEKALVEYARADTVTSVKILEDILVLDPENTTAKSYLPLLQKQ